MIKMKKWVLVVIAILLTPIVLLSLFVTTSAKAAEQSNGHYNFVGFGIEKIEDMAAGNTLQFNPAWLPQVELGKGFIMDIAKDWQLDSRISLTYSKGNLTQFTPIDLDFSSERIGVWGATRLKYLPRDWTVKPFVELSVGRQKHNLSATDISDSGWQNAVKKSAGFEIPVSNTATFSIAFGSSDFSK